MMMKMLVMQMKWKKFRTMNCWMKVENQENANEEGPGGGDVQRVVKSLITIEAGQGAVKKVKSQFLVWMNYLMRRTKTIKNRKRQLKSLVLTCLESDSSFKLTICSQKSLQWKLPRLKWS